MKTILRTIASRLVAPVCKMTLPGHLSVNPRAVEFVMHYLLGSNEDMTLNDIEIAHTKKQWMRQAMENKLGSLDFDEGAVNACHSDDCLDQWAYDNGGAGSKSTPIHTSAIYLSGVTHGVVGGWDYVIDSENCVVKCYDVWDFNPTSLDLELKVPNRFRKMFEKALSLFNVPFVPHEMFGDYTVFEFSEMSLSYMNERHAFTTKWEFSLEGDSCPLYYEQARFDYLTEREQSKCVRPTDEACRQYIEDESNYWF